jgi:putative DNA primase/helicase
MRAAWRARPDNTKGAFTVHLPRPDRSTVNDREILARPLPRCLLSAISYAERGWRVFPVPPGAKKSHKKAAHSGGRRWGAASDPAEIRKDFNRWPGANVGIATGQESRIWVLDVDTPDGHGVDGPASLRALEAEHGALPDTLQARSPSGSVHYYFRWPDGVEVRNSTSQVGPGIDVLGENGIVVAPPSAVPDKGAYVWINWREIADAPRWLITLATAANGAAVEDRQSGEEPEAEPALIAAALAVIPCDDPSFDDFNRVGMATWRASGGSEAGFAAFDSWSAKSKTNYDAAKTAARWEHYFASPPTGIGFGTLCYLADQASPGWRAAYDDSVAAKLTAAARDEDTHAEIMAELDGTDESEPAAGESQKHNGAQAKANEAITSFILSRASGGGDASAKDSRILVDPKDPMATARKVVATSFTTPDGVRTLWRHRGTFWRWIGTHYALADDERLRARVWEFLDQAVRQAGPFVVPFKPTRACVGEVIDALVAVCQLDEHIPPPAWLSSGPPVAPADEFLACGNGLLHLPTGTLHPPTPAYFCLNASTVIYDSAAASPTQWLTFLQQLFGDDVQAIELLQEWFGYALSPDTSQQKIGAIIGPKRSGKGTIARVLTKILGAHSVAGPTMNSLGETFGLEPLITTPLAIVSDVRIGQRTDKSTIVERLLSVSGEDQMTVARKYIRAWTGKLPTRFLLLTNELPALTDGSGALAGRMIVLVLTTSFFGKEDAKLTGKLTAESAGILNWAMAGYRRLVERGHFIQPKSGESAIDDIETLGAPVRAFVRDCCVVVADESVTKADLFQTWKHWCMDENRKDAGTKEWFSRNLHATEPSVSTTRPRVNNGKEREWRHRGIGLNAVGADLLKNRPSL